MAGCSIADHVHWTCERTAGGWQILDEGGTPVAAGPQRIEVIYTAWRVARALRLPVRISEAIDGGPD
jgi:hypothetical protein